MSKELSEDSKFQISIKSLIAITIGVATLVGFYYQLHNEIEEAKQLPKIGTGTYIIDASDANATETYPPTRTEYKMKDQLARQTLLTLQKELEDMKIRIKEIEEKITIVEIRSRRR